MRKTHWIVCNIKTKLLWTTEKNRDCNNEAQATALLAEYGELYAQKVALDKKLKRLEEKAANELCIYKVGMEFVDSKGAHFVLTKIEAVSYGMRGSSYISPCVEFNYTFRKVRKDGYLSLNNSCVRLSYLTFTGKIWDFKAND